MQLKVIEKSIYLCIKYNFMIRVDAFVGTGETSNVSDFSNDERFKDKINKRNQAYAKVCRKKNVERIMIIFT